MERSLQNIQSVHPWPGSANCDSSSQFSLDTPLYLSLSLPLSLSSFSKPSIMVNVEDQLPAPRTFAPSREDVLSNLGFFFGDPAVPEKLKDYSEHRTCLAFLKHTMPSWCTLC